MLLLVWHAVSRRCGCVVTTNRQQLKEHTSGAAFAPFLLLRLVPSPTWPGEPVATLLPPRGAGGTCGAPRPLDGAMQELTTVGGWVGGGPSVLRPASAAAPCATEERHAPDAAPCTCDLVVCIKVAGDGRERRGESSDTAGINARLFRDKNPCDSSVVPISAARL